MKGKEFKLWRRAESERRGSCESDETTLIGCEGTDAPMKFTLEHKLPRRLRYARIYFEAGPTSVLFSLDGASADWHASIGKKRSVGMTDPEYARFRALVPAVELLHSDGERVLIRDSAGYEELWEKPHWTLEGARKRKG